MWILNPVNTNMSSANTNTPFCCGCVFKKKIKLLKNDFFHLIISRYYIKFSELYEKCENIYTFFHKQSCLHFQDFQGSKLRQAFLLV